MPTCHITCNRPFFPSVPLYHCFGFSVGFYLLCLIMVLKLLVISSCYIPSSCHPNSTKLIQASGVYQYGNSRTSVGSPSNLPNMRLRCKMTGNTEMSGALVSQASVLCSLPSCRTADFRMSLKMDNCPYYCKGSCVTDPNRSLCSGDATPPCTVSQHRPQAVSHNRGIATTSRDRCPVVQRADRTETC